MAEKLAVFTTQLGATFINRHVLDLMPGNTVVVARYSDPPKGGFWTSKVPVLYLDRWSLQVSVRLARRAGVSEARLREHAVKRFLQKYGVTVVLGEFLDQFLDFVPVLEKLNIPYVVQGHGVDLSASLRNPGMAERYLAYRSARAVLSRCEFHRQRLIDIGLPPEKVHVNIGGVDIPADKPVKDPASCNRLLAIGANAAKKGPIYLLEAFRIAAGEDPDITLDHIGAGPLLPAIKQFVKACNLSDRVRVHGVVTEELKNKLLAECGIFIQHSITDPDTGDEEGLPAAIQEAMANGLIPVSTRHSGISEAVEDGVNGYLVDEGDVKNMAKAIICAKNAPAERGERAYTAAKNKFSWDHEKVRLNAWLAI